MKHIAFLILFLGCNIFYLKATLEKEKVEAYHEVLDSLNFMDSFSVEEAIDNLFEARKILEEKGYQVPLFSEIVETMVEEIKKRGVSVNSDFFESFYDSILDKESFRFMSTNSLSRGKNELKTMKIKKRKPQKEWNVSEGVAIGFCKTIAGGLLCIIPSGISQTIGTGLLLSGLLLSGINDMIQHAKDLINNTNDLERSLNERQRIDPENMSYIPRSKKRYIDFKPVFI